MQRLLVVDDEDIIVDGLFELFSTLGDMELEILKAYSGIEALEQMRKNKIDIVLSDINMPNMTGLELIKEIKEQWPDCRVIFLTGFNEFDYIQEAIRNGGMDYILKTEPDEAIIEAVRKALNQVEKQVRNEELIERARHNMVMAQPVLQKKYLMDLLEGIKDWNFNDEIRQFNEFNIALKPDSNLILMAGRVDVWNLAENMSDKMKAVYCIQSIAEEYLSKNCCFVPIVYERTKLLWLIQPNWDKNNAEMSYENSEVWSRLVIFVQGMMESIQVKVKEVINVSTSFVVSGNPFNWKEISQNFYSIKLTLDKSAGLGREMLLIDYDEPGSEVNQDKQANEDGEIRYKLKQAELLSTYLDSGQKEEFRTTLSEILGKVKDNSSVSYLMCSEIYYSIALVFLSHINRWNLTDKLDCPSDVNLLLKIEAHPSWEAAEKYFLDLAECIFEHKKDDHIRHNDRVIGFIEEYTKNNLGGDLSIARFAELLHFNPSYLSRMYKQCTGKSISEYISDIKIVKAQKLLKDSNMRINEISISLGFETPSYFTRFFKKKTNLTPQEYRDTIK